MHIASSVAQTLLQIKAVKLNPQYPFTWSSGLLSPIYCDNRKLLSHPNARLFIKAALQLGSMRFSQFDYVAGVATAGIPHGTLLADTLGVPFIYVRDKQKKHGLQNQIEGELKQGARVLVVEDLISTGGSSLRAVDAIREAGAHVVGVLAIFSYGFDKAAEAFKAHKCPLETLSDYDTLVKEALRTGYINSHEADSLTAWRTNPETWGEHIAK